MGTANNWRKSTYSGPGDGDSCVEISVTAAVSLDRPARHVVAAAVVLFHRRWASVAW
ncbi:DUF397 domain-containing protein, partial [Streptomyces sp. NPDC006999]|uniref:DUF397 domain-containing protein n=1 Tax=Streptomyces sp. NPDC006999 TaxID=3156909 RepID=UPI0033D62C3A